MQKHQETDIISTFRQTHWLKHSILQVQQVTLK